jgi:SNF2 family DNA or RNA helicase
VLDFTAPAEVVRTVVEGERLSLGHLANPAFATELAQIAPLPHQRLAVYKHILPQTRLRFLLADDAGAGKTIMAGLYIRELLSRRVIRRVLIVPPAGLVGNWQQELQTRSIPPGWPIPWIMRCVRARSANRRCMTRPPTI